MEGSARTRAPALVATGIHDLDALLPDGGLRSGSVLDLLACGEASGAWTLGLLFARQICGGPPLQTMSASMSPQVDRVYTTSKSLLPLPTSAGGEGGVRGPGNETSQSKDLSPQLSPRNGESEKRGCQCRQTEDRQRTKQNGCRVLVIIDREKKFYPPAAVRLGVDLGRTYVVRPDRDRDAYAAACEALRCGAVGAVLASFERLRLADARRLQLAAERGGSVGLLVLPATAAGPTCATLRCRVSPIGSVRHARRVKMEIVRCRGRGYGQSLLLEIDDATGDVRSLPLLAAAAVAPRPARTPA